MIYLIEKNLETNSVDSKYRVFNLALSDEEKTGKFKAVDQEKYDNHGVGSFLILILIIEIHLTMTFKRICSERN